MALLTATDLRKVYTSGFLRRRGFAAVDGVSFTVERGRTLAVVGESGAGKSTVGRLILRLIEADGGQVQFDNVDVLSLDRPGMRRMRRRMQMVFQDPYSTFDPLVRLAESIAEPLLIHGTASRDERHERALEAMDRVHLNRSLSARLPTQLSGGQLQRAAIARALTLEPELLVLDEPVAALDVSVRAQVVNVLTDLQQELGLAYLFISHDLGLVRTISDDVVIMRKGKIVEQGLVDQIYDDPRDSYTRELLAAVPVLGPRRT